MDIYAPLSILTIISNFFASHFFTTYQIPSHFSAFIENLVSGSQSFFLPSFWVSGSTTTQMGHYLNPSLRVPWPPYWHSRKTKLPFSAVVSKPLDRDPKYLGSINRLDESAQLETKVIFWLLISNTSEDLGKAQSWPSHPNTGPLMCNARVQVPWESKRQRIWAGDAHISRHQGYHWKYGPMNLASIDLRDK